MVFATRVEIANLSLGGVALKADRRLNIGSEYTLKLEREGQAVELTGLVMWSTLSALAKDESGESVAQYSAGLRFSGLFNEEVQSLMHFIDGNRVLPEQRLAGLRFTIDAPDRAVLQGPEHYRVRLVSRSGMLIEADVPLEAEHLYTMELELPDGGPSVHFKGRVASFDEVLDATPRHYEVGVEFLELSDADELRLGRWLDDLKVGQPA